MPVTQLQQRIITKDPQLGRTKKASATNSTAPEYEDDLEMLENMSEVDIKFLETLDPNSITQLPDDHPTIIKYQRELGKIQILERI